MGKEPLHVLILEDRPDDAELMAAELARGGYAPTWTRVDTAGAFLDGLAGEPDIVLADYHLPQFDGSRALALVQSQAAHIPVIILSGTITIEEAVACLACGAADYLPKSEMGRLGAAVRNVLERQRLRHEHVRDAARINELNRMLYAVRGVHRLIVRERDAARFLSGACEILNRVEGFGATWIGRVDAGGARLVPVAGALDIAARMSAGAAPGDGDPWGGFPTHRACSTRRPSVCPDLTSDPECAATLAAVAPLAFTAAAAVPILVGDDLFGTLTVFAVRPEILNQEAVALLADVAADLGRAVQGIEAEHARQAAMQQLEASEVRYRRLFEVESDAIVLVDSQTLYVLDANPAAEQLYGYSREEWLRLRAPEMSAEPEETASLLLSAEELARIPLRYHRRKDGTVFPTEIAVRWFQLGERRVSVSAIRDITARQEAERALRESEERYRTLLERLPLGVYRSSVEGRFLTANRALRELLGYERDEELYALDMDRDVYADPEERHLLIAHSMVSSGDRRSAEVLWKRRGGGTVPVRLTVRTVYDASGATQAFEGVVEDLTERRALEEQLRQGQKIEALGQLAGGFAHDFNNLLTTIGASSDLLADVVPPHSEHEKDLEAIRRAAARGGELTAKLLAFGRRQRIAPQALDLNEAVRDFAEIARRVVPESITILQQLEPGTLPVLADPGAVQQILMNLATNARDAMPDGGMLGLHTARVRFDDHATMTKGWGEPGTFAMLAVRDTGIGMDAANRAHLFEPFFTTKPVDQGTGLGMPMVYGLVQQHHGHIRVLSEPDHGTSVEILLPLEGVVAKVAEPAAPGAAGLRTSGEVVANGRGELILLVDDEPALRRAGKRLLERKGYRVEVASDGAEALDAFLAREQEFALIISDVVMPRMSGPELLTELRRRGKSPRILFTSGYTARDSAQARRIGPGSLFIPKPWNNASFLAAVREALDLGPSAATPEPAA